MPLVFISYSHDSPEHRENVNRFSERLRQDGIETRLDQHVNGTPSEGWPRWMMNGLEVADHVIVICTETYYRRFRGHEVPGKGKGVDWEGALITQEDYDSRNTTTKFVPVFLSAANHDHIPDPLRRHTHYALVSEEAYEALLDFLLGQAGVLPGPVGKPRRKQRTTAEPLTFGPAPTVASTSKPFNLPGGYLGRLFLGRDQFLETLHQSLSATGHATAITQKAAATGISGLGGIGKTHAAVAYADRYHDHYTALLFTSGDTPEKLQSSLADLCGVLNLDKSGSLPPDEPFRVRAALDWLAAHPGWLLIIDNVDDEKAALSLRDLLGHLSAGRVLITTRLHGWSDQVKNLDLDVLEESAAAELLLRLTDDRRRKTNDDDSQALLLVRLLDGLPLAIHQASGFINERARTLAQYHQHYLRESETLLAWFNDLSIPYERPEKLAPRSVLVTWKSSFEQLTDEVRFWLLVFSHFAPEPIPEFLLEPTQSAAPEQIQLLARASAAVARAEKFSLLTRSRTEPTFKIHRLVQQIIRLQAEEEERHLALNEAIHLIDLVHPGPPLDVRSWPKWNPLQIHATSICDLAPDEPAPKQLSWLLNQLGLLLRAKHHPAPCEACYRRALHIDRAAFGDDHPEVAVNLNNLARLLHATNRLPEAEPLIREALRIDRAAFGDEHPEVAVDLGNLASMLQSTNRFAEAEPLMREALRINRTAFGDNHPEVAINLSNLATLLHDTDRLAEAEPLMREALRIDRAAFGDDHPKVALRLNNLAPLLKATNRMAEAEHLMREALRIDIAAFGDKHPKIAVRLNNLAVLLAATNRTAEAEPLMREALRIDRSAFGDNHPAVARDLNNLAALLQETGRPAEAARLVLEALRVSQTSKGSDHPDTQAIAENQVILLARKTKGSKRGNKKPADS